MKSVLLVGCGNIGFRHLQALSAMQLPADVLVVEPNQEQHARILSQFADTDAGPHRFELTSEVPDDGRSFALAVIATTAMHRRSAVEALLAGHDVDAMILEKVLFQTIDDLDAVEALLDQRSVTGWVNCGRRTFPGYQTLWHEFDGGPVDIRVSGQRLGLASNTVHFLDLAEYLNRSALVSIDLSGLTPGSVPARHPDCVEIFGTIEATLANGSHVVIESLDVDPVQVVVELTANGQTTTIDELARTMQTDRSTSVPFAAQNVSETPEIYEAAALGQAPTLTPYADSARQHRFYLDALCEHLGLDGSDSEPCPIS